MPEYKKKPLIAVYGIYKNEEKCMMRFLESVKDADEIILCDTGSSDKSNLIIKQFQDNNPAVNLKSFNICVSPFRFDDARNTSLSLVSSNIDLCISLDIDEYLMDNWKNHLSEQYELGYTRYYHKFKTFWPEGNISEHWHERIHSRTGYSWKLPVHEILEFNGQEKIKWLQDFWMYQKPDQEKSRSSYLPLLEQSVRERGDIWKSWSFLSDEYVKIGRYEDAMKSLDSALDIEDSDKSFLYKKKFDIYKYQNKLDLALLSLNNAIILMPGRREPYFEKALYLHELGKHLESYFSIKDAEKMTNKIIDYHYNWAAWDSNFELWKSKLLELAKQEGL